MSTLLLQRLLQDAQSVPDQRTGQLTPSYFAFLDYFKQIPIIEAQHFIISANFTYGWMPRMLRLRNGDFDAAATVLNKAKSREQLGDHEIQALKDLMNNSIVGVSKILHFANPYDYAIWDRHVAFYLEPDMGYNRFKHIDSYRSYLEQCASVSKLDGFISLHQVINQKFDRPVTPFRAIELIMYTKGTNSNIERSEANNE